jgi:hypothetical protein
MSRCCWSSPEACASGFTPKRHGAELQYDDSTQGEGRLLNFGSQVWGNMFRMYPSGTHDLVDL